jgi:hypothetical protein
MRPKLQKQSALKLGSHYPLSEANGDCGMQLRTNEV